VTLHPLGQGYYIQENSAMLIIFVKFVLKLKQQTPNKKKGKMALYLAMESKNLALICFYGVGIFTMF